MTNIKKTSLEDIKAMKERGELHATRNNAPEIDMPDGFWDDAEIVDRSKKQSIHLRVDSDILEYFKSEGKGHLTRMNAVLRSYVEAKTRRTTN